MFTLKVSEISTIKECGIKDFANFIERTAIRKSLIWKFADFFLYNLFLTEKEDNVGNLGKKGNLTTIK